MSAESNPQMSYEVAVVGLGPVGAVLCALLGERGIDVVGIEPELDAAAYPRAIAADDEMLRTLLRVPGLRDASGVFDTDQRVEVRDGERQLLTSVSFEGSSLGVSGLSFFHQPTMERVLRTALAAIPSVDVLYGRRVEQTFDEPAAVRLRLDDGATVSARWVVGCDGATSAVRRLRGIAYSGRTFSEPWLVIDVDSPAAFEHLPCFTYVLDRRRPAVNMPRPGGHRFEFMALEGEDPDGLASTSNVALLLEPYLAPLAPQVRSGLRVVRAAVYTFHSRVADRWRDGRFLLAGDAAHCMPPFGGQGLGAGIGDALALAWRLDEVVRGVSPPRVLAGYEAERRPRIAEMKRTALVAGRLLTPQSRTGSAAASSALRLVNGTPWLGARFRSGALRTKPSVATPRAQRRLRGGRPLPNPRIRTLEPSSAMTGLRLDDVLPAGWALLGRGRDPAMLVSEATRSALQARDANNLIILAPGALIRAEQQPCPAIEDLDGWLLALWPRRAALSREHPDGAVLVRPDRFIAVVGDGAAIAAALARLIGSGG